ncbi:DUF4132 domain-containing protein [Sphingomonas alpina]|uniref:DUF4132 domain-containing protein n=1 Tax=Sphingomonas alpina TaxID=653931 RepID=UPI0021BAF80C|nr:DUF4132 domain-containing protein [Sphingomonas alpina]
MLGKTSQALVRGEIQPGPEVLRLLQVRIATKYVRAPWNKQLTDAELAVTGLNEMLYHGLSLMQGNYKVKWEEVIPLKTAFAHFRQVGGTLLDLFALILRRTESEFVTQSVGSWSASDDLAGYLNTYPAAFAEALRLAEPRPRANGVKLAEYHKATSAPEIESVLVAMLTRPFDQNDREIATSALARLAPEQLLNWLQRYLPQADIDTRYGLVQAAGRNGAATILALLAERAKVEKAAKVQAAIQAILEVDAVEEAPPIDGQPNASGYAAIDGSFVTLPPLADLGEPETGSASAEDRAAFMRIVEAIVAHRTSLSEESCDRTRFFHRLDDNDIDATFELMTQGAPLRPGTTYALVSAIRQREDGRAWYAGYLGRLPVGAALRALMANGYSEMRLLTGADTYIRESERFALDRLGHWIADHGIGLREIETANHAAKTGLSFSQAANDPAFNPALHLREILNRQQLSYDRRSVFESLRDLDPRAVWPWLAGNMGVLDEALGLKPAEKPIPLDRALEALELLPRMPQRYFAKLLDIAVSEKRPLRRRAMALLRDGRDLTTRIEALLDDKRQLVRSNAATWLADIRSTASEGALRKRLKNEKSDPVRAALIESLQRMGFDLSDVIGPLTLIAEAEAAFAKAAPNLPAWLTANGLPAPHFRDGSTVPQLLVQHWLALAIRLKDPAASGQFGIYLDQLLQDDARTFSNWVLDAWIAFDTHTSSLEEATAYAMANYQQHFSWLCRYTKPPGLREEVIAQMTREKTGELLNSGSEAKGMLALACRADPVFAANRVRWFLKKHGRRSNQAMALLEVLAGIGQPVALQVVIAASVRLKQKSTQARAAEIAERYAEDRGWSFDELADRTVPSAGFDDDGVLELPSGEDGKLYTARLDAMLAIHLFNPDDKAVKSLPAGDDEATRESKKAFAGAKKELAQVIELQGTRLFEAMCVERAWPVADWRLAFHEHPVMRRLVERLVWQGLNEDGHPLGLFRPTQEGDFTDAGDNPVDIDGFAKVRLAHGALTDEATCRAWAGHLKDYEIKPFLAQFDTLRAPLSAEQGEAEAILDRQGWKADSLTFRGAAEKRGYERIMRDGGGCHEYEKKFPSHGITATIFHTGSHAVDENNPLALKELHFTKQGHRGTYRIKDVPPVMLAECWADYHAVAARGAFDPEWEKLSPW